MLGSMQSRAALSEMQMFEPGPQRPQIEMKVIDPDTGDIVPVGESGELCCRGYLVMLGYFEMHTYLHKYLCPHKTARSWYRVDEFPLTGSGKVQKFAIVEAWEKASTTTEMSR